MSNPKVLLVEYDDSERSALKRHLQGVGLEVLEARNPEEARRFAGEDVQALLTHQHFPDKYCRKDFAQAGALCTWAVATWPGVLLFLRGRTPTTDQELREEYGFPPVEWVKFDIDRIHWRDAALRVKEDLQRVASAAS